MFTNVNFLSLFPTEFKSFALHPTSCDCTYIILLIIHCNVYYYYRPYFLSNHLDGLPVDPEVHVLVLGHDPPPAPPRQRLPDQEGDPLPADRDTRTPGLRLKIFLEN